MAVFLSDSMTEASDLTLASHTPETGGAWVRQPSFAQLMSVVASEDRARGASTTASSCYYNDATPPSADYTVSATVRRTTTGDSTRVGVCARVSSSTNTLYYVFQNGGTLELHKNVAGTDTTLATASITFSTNTDYTLALEVIGSSIKVYWQGSEVTALATTDTSITAAGFPGLLCRSNGRLDTVTADSASGATSNIKKAGGVSRANIKKVGAVAINNVKKAGSVLN